MKHDKVAIIGAGPAGIACAVQLKRYGQEFLLFEKNQTGGLLRNANLVENYIGLKKSISGQALVKNFRKNLKDLDIEPILTEVKKVSFSGNCSKKHFVIETATGSFTSEILVVASGTKPKKSEIIQTRRSPSAEFLRQNKKIFYEIVDLNKSSCAGKKFAIIGAGDAAFDYAINLVNNYNVSDVSILNRSEQAKCLPLLEKRALETGKIKYFKNIHVESIAAADKKVILSGIKDKNNFNLEADFIIFAVGREPCLDFLSEELLNDNLKLQKERLLYFIGDVANDNYRQTSIATGNGIKTAMKIYSTKY